MSSAIVIGASAMIDSFWNQRRGARSWRRQREGQEAPARDEDGHDLGVGLHGDAGDRPEQPERFGVGLDIVRQIDGEPPLAPEHAHQPPADEDMLGVEGDGAGKLAPRLQPDRIRRFLVEYVQRLLRQQRQHQRGVESRLVPDRIDDRRIGLAGRPDRRIADAVDELERHVEECLPEPDAEPERLDHGKRQPYGEQAEQDGS